MRKMTTEEFVTRSRAVHGDRYGYDKVVYAGSGVRVTLVCPVHGDIRMLPFNHLNNKRGCKACGLARTHAMNKVTVAEFVARCPRLRDYTYDTLAFETLFDDVVLTCPVHGPFTTKPKNLLRGQGCTQCSHVKRRCTAEQFIDRARAVHGGRFGYDKVRYNLMHDRVVLTCPVHGEFEQKPYLHLQGHGCAKCANFTSTAETEILEFMRSLGCDARQSYRGLSGVWEVDVYLPNEKLAVEYNGLYWHCDLNKADTYHVDKTNAVEANGVRLIQVFEDEWHAKRPICESRLRDVVGKTGHRVYARDTEVRCVDHADASEFLRANHLQGPSAASVRYGLYADKRLVSLMTFGRYRRNLGRRSVHGCYEMVRFCNVLNTSVVGGASRLFARFVRDYAPIEVISYADRRWSDGGLYAALGFAFVRDTRPGYAYINPNKKIRENRFKYRKSVLDADGCRSDKTERELAGAQGLYRIYDCGNKLFAYRRDRPGT